MKKHSSAYSILAALFISISLAFVGCKNGSDCCQTQSTTVSGMAHSLSSSYRLSGNSQRDKKVDRARHDRNGNLPPAYRDAGFDYQIEQGDIVAKAGDMVTIGDILEVDLPNDNDAKFQWYRNDDIFTLGTYNKATLEFTIPNTGTFEGFYSCEVTIRNEKTISNPIRLIVTSSGFHAEGITSSAAAPITLGSGGSGTCPGAYASYIRYMDPSGASTFKPTKTTWNITLNSPTTTNVKIMVKDYLTQKSVYCDTLYSKLPSTGPINTTKNFTVSTSSRYYVAAYFSSALPNGTTSQVTINEQ